MTITTRTNGRYIGRTGCCNAPVAIEVTDATPAECPADFPTLSRAERRALRVGAGEDPRAAYIVENGAVTWAEIRDERHIPSRANTEPFTRASAYAFCSKCEGLALVTATDAVRGTHNDTTCSHSCIRAASIECFCSCGGSRHGELHTVA